MNIFRPLLRCLSVLVLLAAAGSCMPRNRYIQFTGYAQGTYSVKINLEGVPRRFSRETALIQQEIDAILTHIDTTLSGLQQRFPVEPVQYGRGGRSERDLPGSLCLVAQVLHRDRRGVGCGGRSVRRLGLWFHDGFSSLRHCGRQSARGLRDGQTGRKHAVRVPDLHRN